MNKVNYQLHCNRQIQINLMNSRPKWFATSSRLPATMLSTIILMKALRLILHKASWWSPRDLMIAKCSNCKLVMTWTCSISSNMECTFIEVLWLYFKVSRWILRGGGVLFWAIMSLKSLRQGVFSRRGILVVIWSFRIFIWKFSRWPLLMHKWNRQNKFSVYHPRPPAAKPYND